MYHIWGFFLQTISVSIVALVILLLKKLFEDKLSPRWQYAIWSLLAIRILIPTNISTYILPQAALWIEILKAQVERNIDSAFCGVYEPIVLKTVIPVLTEMPQSITDWLFVVYVIGVVLCLSIYCISYIALRFRLFHALPVSVSMEEKMLVVCETYHLKPCEMIAVEGVSTAFICGVTRPKLVIPYAKELDEKVLLHELLHKKYNDTFQNIFWCILRALHWCNPLIQFVINTIENDIEALCDQRVLELLEGEERREYGIILLDMANQKYARNPGTSSISNGSKNIAKRIASIVRFKKYPQGMTLVSICIILVLFWPTIVGSAATYDMMDYKYYNDNATLEKSMAIARVNRCGTIAGAIDMYTKGIYKMNGAYVASASSFSEHERIANELIEYGCYQPGKYIANINYLHDFYVCNLEQKEEKEYSAFICLYVMIACDEYTPVYNDYVPYSEEYDGYSAFILIPVSITYDNGWCIEETGERTLIPEEVYIRQETPYTLCGKEYYGRNDVGEIQMLIETKYEIDHKIQNDNLTIYNSLWNDMNTLDFSPSPNADFNYQYIGKQLTYTHLLEETPFSYIELKVNEWELDDDSFMKDAWRIFEYTDDWKGFFYSGTGGGGSIISGDIEELELLPDAYKAKLNIGGTDMEDIIIEEVTD